jgi:hypothetical protein
MIETIISLKEVLTRMDAGEDFSLICYGYDAHRTEKVGKVKQYDSAKLLVHADKNEAQRPLTTVEKLHTGIIRKPNKQTHFVRDIQPLTGGISMGNPVRIHPRLILFFNQIKVVP